MKAIFSRMSTPPKTSVTSSPQSPLLPLPPYAQVGGQVAVGRPDELTQAVLVPPERDRGADQQRQQRLARRGCAARVRCAISVIVACGVARGAGVRRRAPAAGLGHRRRCPERVGQRGAVGRAGLLGAGPELGGARPRRPRASAS